MLKIADNLSLPLDAVTGTFALLAIRGAGKTHTASILAEEMLEAGQPIVAYDPTGAWWGLKSSASGKQAGYPVVVFGGEHADVPLEETAGETIASTIVSKRIPAILDCSLLRKAARIRFMTAFCETLYHQNREPLHLFLDEAHTVAPQNIRAMPEATTLLGAIEDIILQGRKRGLGLTAISPRPAMLNTSVRSACQTLIAMRVGSGKHDRKAVEEWVEAHAAHQDMKQFLASLAGLPRGEGWIWNPAEDLFKLVKFRRRRTFDSSATPKVGERVITPQRMAKIDLETLGAAIKSTVETAKANDPKELKKRVAELERENAKLAKQPPAKVAAVTKTVELVKRVEVPAITKAELKRLETTVVKMEAIQTKLAEFASAIWGKLAKVASAPAAPQIGTQLPPYVGTLRNGAAPKLAPRPPAPVKAVADPTPGKEFTPSESAVLSTLAQFPSGATRKRVSVFSGRSGKSSSFQAAFPELVRRGLIATHDGTIFVATDQGKKLVGVEPLPTGPALIAHWRGKLTPSERKVFDALVSAFPRQLTREEVADLSNQSTKSSSFQAAFPALRSLELIEGDKTFAANPMLFEDSE